MSAHGLQAVYVIKAGRPRGGVQRWDVRAVCRCGERREAWAHSRGAAASRAKKKLDTHIRRTAS